MENTVNILFAPHDKTTNMFFSPRFFSQKHTCTRKKPNLFAKKHRYKRTRKLRDIFVNILLVSSLSF